MFFLSEEVVSEPVPARGSCPNQSPHAGRDRASPLTRLMAALLAFSVLYAAAPHRITAPQQSPVTICPRWSAAQAAKTTAPRRGRWQGDGGARGRSRGGRGREDVADRPSRPAGPVGLQGSGATLPLATLQTSSTVRRRWARPILVIKGGPETPGGGRRGAPPRGRPDLWGGDV